MINTNPEQLVGSDIGNILQMPPIETSFGATEDVRIHITGKIVGLPKTLQALGRNYSIAPWTIENFDFGDDIPYAIFNKTQTFQVTQPVIPMQYTLTTTHSKDGEHTDASEKTNGLKVGATTTLEATGNFLGNEATAKTAVNAETTSNTTVRSQDRKNTSDGFTDTVTFEGLMLSAAQPSITPLLSGQNKPTTTSHAFMSSGPRPNNDNYDVYSIPMNGNSLFLAVSDQLKFNFNQDFTATALRTLAVQYMTENKLDFVDAMEDEENIDDHIEKITSEDAWGGKSEIRALSDALNLYIVVVNSSTQEKPTYGVVTNPRVYLWYNGQTHYDSYRPKAATSISITPMIKKFPFITKDNASRVQIANGITATGLKITLNLARLDADKKADILALTTKYSENCQAPNIGYNSTNTITSLIFNDADTMTDFKEDIAKILVSIPAAAITATAAVSTESTLGWITPKPFT